MFDVRGITCTRCRCTLADKWTKCLVPIHSVDAMDVHDALLGAADWHILYNPVRSIAASTRSSTTSLLCADCAQAYKNMDMDKIDDMAIVPISRRREIGRVVEGDEA